MYSSATYSSATYTVATFAAAISPAAIVPIEPGTNHDAVKLVEAPSGSHVGSFSPSSNDNAAAVATADVNGDDARDLVAGIGPGCVRPVRESLTAFCAHLFD